MSIVTFDGVGGEWNEDGTPTENSLNQEPLKLDKKKKRRSYAQLEAENEALKNVNRRRLGIIKSHGRQLTEAAQWEWEQEQDEALLQASP